MSGAKIVSGIFLYLYVTMSEKSIKEALHCVLICLSDLKLISGFGKMATDNKVIDLIINNVK